MARRAHGLQGIIPAYAGSTAFYDLGWEPMAGSSPHTRGAQLG